MAADHHIQQHQHQPQQQQQQPQQHQLSREDSLERLFPRCRLRSPPVDTAVLIDLSDDSHVQPAVPPPSLAPPTSMTQPAVQAGLAGQSDSDASPLRRPPSLKLNIGVGQSQIQPRRYCPSVKYRTESAELRRSKLRRPKTLDSWALYGDLYGGGGYEPSPDSEENDSDGFNFQSKSTVAAAPPSSSGSSSSLRRSTPSTVRTSASEPHIVGHWKKGGQNGAPDVDRQVQHRHHHHQRRRGVKEIYDLTPTRLELGSPSAGSASGGGGGSGSMADPTRMEIAGGREIVSLSRSRTRASQRKQRHSVAHPSAVHSTLDSPHNNNNNNNNSTPSSSNRSINRYSGEVYYEESMGRYGFHVGGGNTLWGSQGLEPSFSIPSNLNEKPFANSGGGIVDPGTPAERGHHHRKHHGLKRPLSWAGDDAMDAGQELERQQPASTSSPDHYDQSPAEMKDCDGPSEQDYQSIRSIPNGLLPGIEEPSCETTCQQMKAVRGYLTDFYPEVIGAENGQNGTDPSSGQDSCRPLNLDNYLSEQLNQFAQQSARKEVSESEDAAQQLPSQSPPVQQQLTVATVIGGLTIAQYEGSPRRYGVRPHPVATANGQEDYSDDSSKPTTNGAPVPAPPRSLVPGFPRRVTSSPNPAHPQATFSPSATRQTLVDLTSSTGPAAVSTPVSCDPIPVAIPAGSHHLGWHLDAEVRSRQVDQGDTGSLNAETDLGETEVGHEMGKSRNFTLSPETTDYDDSELDVNGMDPSATALSLAESSSIRQTDPLCPSGGQSSRRGSNKSQNGSKQGQFSSMPILEDGLSSGASSVGSGDESSQASSGSVTSASDTEEDAVTDRIPLMADRQRRMKAPLSVHGQHPLHSVNNGCRNLAGTSPLQSTSSVTGPSGARPAKISHQQQQPQSQQSQQQQQQQSLWVKKLSASNSECDHIHRHHPESTMTIQGSFRARDATPPPPAPLAHRPPATHVPTTSPSTVKKSFATASSAAAAVSAVGQNSNSSPLRLSPGPDTPSVTSGGAGSSGSSTCSSSGVGSSSAIKMNSSQQQLKSGPAPDLSLHELDEALDHGRARKANSMPPSSVSGHSPLSHSPPVWVPRQNNDYWVKTSPSSTSPRSTRNVGAVGSTNHPDGNKLNEDDDERETDQLLRDPDDQGFFDEHARPQVALDVSRVHPATRMGAPIPTSSSPPTPSSMRSASTTSSTQSSPQQQPVHLHQPAQQPPTVSGSAATTSLTNGTTPSASSSTAGIGGAPPPSRQSEPKDLKYRETPPSAKKKDDNTSQSKKKGRSKEVMVHEPAVLIEGVLFRANYLGSTQIVCEGQPTKYTRMMQAEEAVSRIKAPEGETQPTTEVDLFISTEKIMVLNTELKEIMMDHALRTISYIADIGDLVVLMARRRMITQDGEDSSNKIAKTPKMVCHVFESEEAQFIAQSIGQAFQVAYMEFLKANGIEDQSFVREMDYQEVLNSQEIFGDELQMFAKKELQKEVIVPKARNEILGVVIVESGWGSMLPTVVIANLAPAGAAARCGQLNIGDQIIAINGISLVGLPLSTCQTYIKNAKSATVVKLTVVPCPPVVEVKIKRPDTKYQLGFSVQNGVICSLLRGGIAERGGVRVGHRIIEINGQSVVAVPHERIVGLLATSVGEINMKTMPTSMFRLLIGQETPVYI